MYSPKRVFELCLELISFLSKKESGKKGRPAIYPDHLYVALLVLRSYFNRTYRETETFFRGSILRETLPGLSSLALVHEKEARGRSLGLLELLKERLCPLLQPDEMLFLDSTGIPHRGKAQEFGFLRGRPPRIVRVHSRL